jgi:hypothetical protein
VSPTWTSRLTWVSTSGINSTGRNASVGTIITAERLMGVRIRCPRCDAPAAALWRRFDYYEHQVALYFTKCRRCLRRRSIDSSDAAFRLMEAGVEDAESILPEPSPGSNGAAGAGVGAGPDAQTAHRPDDDTDSTQTVEQAQQLLANRQRAYGPRHPLTFSARADLAQAVGRSGDAERAAGLLDALVADQSKRSRATSPPTLANRYLAATWTARAGRPEPALADLRALLIDQTSTLGADHANSLITRATIASLVMELGDGEAAKAMLQAVHKEELQALGSEHPATEAARRLLEEWGESAGT